MSMKYFWRDLEIFPLTNVALCFCNDPPSGHVSRPLVPEPLIGQLMVTLASDGPFPEFLSPLLSNHLISDFKRPQCRVNEQRNEKDVGLDQSEGREHSRLSMGRKYTRTDINL